MAENRPYISCIKINGAPIVPPLLTPRKRSQCRDYRQLAVDLERRLERNRLFRRCMDDLASLQQQTVELASPQRHRTTSLEMRLALDDRGALETTNEKLRHLTTETIDVTEYNNVDGVRFITKEAPEPQPKLVRSNSYTLEAPSPILLAHMEREALKNASTSSEEPPPEKVESPPAYYLVETDITVQQVSVSTPLETYEITASNLSPEKEIEPQLAEVLGKLSPDCASKIMEIFEKQKREQASQARTHDSLKNKILGDSCHNLTNRKRPPSLSISSNQSLYYSVTSSSDAFTPESAEKSETEDLNVMNLQNSKRCSRRLFDDVEAERKWAASVIGAAVRGYLVRRLIRTEKVQGLIETIKDALLCAIQLHNAEIIDEADIELHRRLIQQVSAACYAFHDIFFALSTKEQMNVIAADRQRRIERANRPLSASSRISDSALRRLRT